MIFMKYDVRCNMVEPRQIKNGEVVGLASIIIDDKFAVNSIRLIRRNDENGTYRIMFPDRPSSNTQSGYKNIAYPISSDLYYDIYNAVIDSYYKGEVVTINNNAKDYTVTATLFNKDNVRGYAQLNFGKEFVVNDITIYNDSRQGKEDFVSMPSYKRTDGTYQNICNPITKDAYIEFDNAIKGAYQSALDEEAAKRSGLERSASVEDNKFAAINQKQRDMDFIDDYLKDLDNEYDM